MRAPVKTFLRTTAHLGLFAISLLATAAAIRSVDRVPFWGPCQRPIRHLASGVGQYDTLFVGSSRFMRGIDPQRFDAAMAEQGHPTHSYSLSIGGLQGYDFDAILDWVATNRPPHLRRVFVELHKLEPRPPANWMTAQQTEGHTPRHWLARIRAIANGRRPWSDRAWSMTAATAHTLANLLRIGQGPRIMSSWLEARNGKGIKGPRTIRGRGFRPMDPKLPTFQRRIAAHREWLANREVAVQDVVARSQPTWPQPLTGDFPLDSIEQRFEHLTQAGLEVVHVIAPEVTLLFRGRDRIAELPERILVLAFDRPPEFPAIYRHELWYDGSHLMPGGAELFSTELATRYAQTLPPR